MMKNASVESILLFVLLSIISLTMAGIYYIHIKESPIRDVGDIEQNDIITETIRKRSKKIRLAGVQMSVRTYYAIMAAATVALFFIAFNGSGNLIISTILAVIGCFIPNLIINLLRSGQNKKFSENYQKALEVMSASLKAGGTIKKAVRDVAESPFIPMSVRKYFKKIDAELEMGVSISDSFRNFAEETGNYYVEETYVAIDVQNTVGNREDVVIKNISTNISDEIIMNKKINSTFATTISMVRLMNVLPIAVMILFTVANRSYVEVYFSSPLMMAVYFALFCMPIIGSCVTHKMLTNVKSQI